MKILVLSDNVMQFKRIKKIFDNHKDKSIKVNYAHSHIKSEIWDLKYFKNKNFQIEIKKELHFLIETFDLIISVHCKQIFPSELIEKVRCINIHPGFNPINRGWFPQVFAIVNELPIGATIHEMDSKLDNGPIISRALVPVFQTDTSLELYNRILEKEIELFEENLESIIKNSYKTFLPEGEGNLFFKNDFYNLCKINIEEKLSFKEIINRLRGLTHGEFKNAYFLGENGKKIFISINLEEEN